MQRFFQACLVSRNSIAALILSLGTVTVQALPQYRGFWASAMSGIGTGNYIAESAAKGSNTVMIREESPAAARAKLQQARAYGQKAILMIQQVLYPWNHSKIHDDFPLRFQNYWAELADFEDVVVGFYIHDEPYYHNSRSTYNGIWDGFLQNQMNVAARYLKGRFPDKLTYVTFSHQEIKNPRFQSEFNPQDVDVIGVNCYVAFGDACNETEIYRLIHMVQTLKAPHQKIILTADGYVSRYPTLEDDLQIAQRLRFWKMLAASYGDVIAFFPFLYQSSISEEESLYGLELMPNAMGEVSIYFAALNSTAIVCDSNDLVWIKGGAVADRWSNAPMCVPACERGDLVRRTARGEFVDRWPSAPMCN